MSINACKPYSRLAIIGNGFDLAHDFNTRYSDFTGYYDEECFKAFNELFERYKTPLDKGIKWNEFEKAVFLITNRMIAQDLSFQINCAADLEQLNQSFAEIQRLFIDYLRHEQASKPIHTLPNIAKFLTKDCIALNFNYTNIAAAYSCCVVYVHGSLAENDIILGFDPLDPYCPSTYEERKWEKISLRRIRSFKKYLREHTSIVPGSKEYTLLCSGMIKIEELAHSGKGFDLEDIRDWPQRAMYEKFLSHCDMFDEYNELFPLSESRHCITELIIAGHSLDSDNHYLSRILEQFPNIKTCMIFHREETTHDKLEKMKELICLYCKNISSEDIQTSLYK